MSEIFNFTKIYNTTKTNCTIIGGNLTILDCSNNGFEVHEYYFLTKEGNFSDYTSYYDSVDVIEYPRSYSSLNGDNTISYSKDGSLNILSYKNR